MDRYQNIRDRLHSLYRPEDRDTGLLVQFLRTAARLLDGVDSEANSVMQAHWFAYADRALYDPFFNRQRALGGLPQLTPDAPELQDFPYLHDLARLAALLSLAPWQDPPSSRHLVETFRQYVGRIVKLYTRGLGTREALRRMTEAQLPVDKDAPAGQRDRPFWIEEFPPSPDAETLTVHDLIAPVNLVGPLMRWELNHDGLEPAPPTIYIEGLPPQLGLVDAAINPSIELYQAQFPRLAIAYAGTVAPGQTLRLRPAYCSWLASNGLLRAESLSDPTAPGPWSRVPGVSEFPVTALHQAQDRTLWAATDQDGAAALHRHDGTAWTAALSGLARVHCLAEDGDDLLIGTQTGLLRMPLHPKGNYAATAVLAGVAVFASYRTREGDLWLGTAAGARVLKPNGPTPLPDTEVFSIAQDDAGTLYFGTALGLFQYQPGTGRWFAYWGESCGPRATQWRECFPDKPKAERRFPGETEAFLPPVRCVLRGPDASLWLGTDFGIARYTARRAGGLSFDTVLEAFPDLGAERVSALAVDARGLVWFATARGLFRYDGRDFWQYRQPAWQQLGAADTLYEEALRAAGEEFASRGAWRYDRFSKRWQRSSPAGSWEPVAVTVRSAAESPVTAFCWTEGALGELGSGHGKDFALAPDGAPVKLVTRFKPNEQTILNGGIPAIPRVPVGSSVWRYLAMETKPEPVPPLRPAYTREGRLLPPAPPSPAPAEGRFDIESPRPRNEFDAAVFAYHPAAKVWFEWRPRRLCAVLIRLKNRTPGEQIDPVVLDRVYQACEQVRPAGVRALLAVEENTVRGTNHGTD